MENIHETDKSGEASAKLILIPEDKGGEQTKEEEEESEEATKLCPGFGTKWIIGIWAPVETHVPDEMEELW